MWSIIGILSIGIFVSLFEIPPLIKKKWWKEIIVYFLFLSAGLTLCILLSKNVTIPNPVDLIMTIYSPIISLFE